MDFTRNVRRSNFNREEDILSLKYPHDLQLYDTAPTSTVLLHDFEEMALDRLKVLKAIETVSMKGFVRHSTEWQNSVKEELNKQGLKTLNQLYSSPGTSEGKKGIIELRRKDHISHFILAMAFCRTEELRQWFISKEIDLFHYRFSHLVADGVKNFMQINHLEFQPISENEKQARIEKLRDTYQFLKQGQHESTDFYKIQFRKVLDLVRNRRVLMERGYSYIAATDLVNVLASRLRQEMNHTLAVLRQSLPETTEDRRLDAVLKCLLEHHEAGSYKPKTDAGETLRMEDLDDVSKKSFPPCMRRLHEALRTKHHLRHNGRQQYQLFLKGAGLPLEESLRFWRTEFMKIMAVEKFEKEHSYNIRHNYGKEGNRVNYSPMGCNKIIHSTPGPEDFHGCPFRHCKPQELRRLLLSYGINTKGLTEVMEYVEGQLFPLACQKLFLLTHGDKAVEFGMSHPNQYFAESRLLLTGVKIEKPAASTPSSNVNSPSVTPGPSSKVGTPVTPRVNSTPLSSKTPAQSTPTPVSSKTPAHSTPMSSRRALPTTKKPSGSTKDCETAKNVADWLDEPDEDLLSQLEAMDTTH